MSSQLSKQKRGELAARLIADEAALVKRIDELRREDPFADPDHANDNAAIDTDVREQVGHDTIEAQIATLQKKLNLVRAASRKVIKGKYGLCESCGEPIKMARLEFLPEARYCIVCEKRLVK